MTVRLKIHRPKIRIAPVVWTALALGAFGLVILAQQPVNVANTPAVTQSSGPWTQNLTQVAGSTLGAITTYGTSPGAVNVPSVNAFVTNSPSVSFGPTSASSGAISVFHVVGSTSTFNTVKASAGNVYGAYVFNPNATPCYLVFYNATAPTIGTTGIVQAFGIQAGTQAELQPGSFAMANFSTGITVASTTTDGGSSVCGTGMSLNVWYQ